MQKRAAPERSIQASIVKYLRLALPGSAWVGAIPGGDGKVTRAPGYIPGTPDVLIIHDGRAFLIEVKSARGRVSHRQVITAGMLRLAGATVGYARSIDDAEILCRGWKLPLKGSATAVRAEAA